MGGKPGIFWVSLLNLVIFMGLINYIFDMSGWKFLLELVFLLGLLFFALVSVILIYSGGRLGYAISAFVSALAMVNLMLIYFRMEISSLLFLSMVSAITLFVMSISGIAKEEKEFEIPEPPKQVYVEKYGGEQEKKAVKKSYSPGKLVSSKSSNYYHAPKCDWAKKIKKSNRVWYDSESAAKRAGLKKHTCLK
jgi:hypothetical protein